MANKRKTTTALVAGVTAAALMLGGTFAWTSISQTALNESAGIVNVGGRLHDDFNGTNKDVYVENFTDPLNGGQPIYARVKLTEYMEVGSEAGQTDNADRKATPVVEGTDINNDDTWTVHKPETDCAVCETEGTCRIHSHWEWTMGGQTTFMPTFNKDKDSLVADINGTYAGTNPTDKVYYDDYVVYTTEEGGITVNMTDETFVAPAGATNATPLTEATDNVTTVIGTEYYDNDTNIEPNDHTVENAEDGGYRIEENMTHTAKQTATAEVITMAQWLSEDTANGGKSGAPGNYWVYDDDGWAYWANPIMPGEATGLLLSNIEMKQNPGEKCYYAINVVGQFATVGDWTQFGVNEEDPDYPSTEALAVLTAASQNVATVTVNNVSGATLLTPGESYEFSANVSVNGQQVLAASDFEWSVLDADNKVSEKSTIEIDEDGKAMLNVAEEENSKNLIVVAKAINSDYLGALGMSSVAVAVEELVICEELAELAAAEVHDTVTIDYRNWYVLAKEENRVLIWAADLVASSESFGTSTDWSESNARESMNGYWLADQNAVRNHAVETTFYTKDASGAYVENTDKVFFLSEADLFGTIAGEETAEPKVYTLGKAGIIVTDEMLTYYDNYWLRTEGGLMIRSHTLHLRASLIRKIIVIRHIYVPLCG